MLVLEIAAGIILAIILLIFWREILALVGVAFAITALALAIFVIASYATWDGVLVVGAVAAVVGSAITIRAKSPDVWRTLMTAGHLLIETLRWLVIAAGWLVVVAAVWITWDEGFSGDKVGLLFAAGLMGFCALALMRGWFSEDTKPDGSLGNH